MIQEMNFIRCTCDVCKKSFDVDKNKKNPLKSLILPMQYLDECGGYQGHTTGKVDVCNDCLKQMEKDISEYYNLKTVAYAGVLIERRVK